MQESQYNNYELRDDSGDESPEALSKGQKIAVASLAFFALFIVVIWSFQFKNALSQPFKRDTGSESVLEVNSSCPDGNCGGSDEALREKDTDGDGLSDYDELNIYKTSPYLEDSDSDGFSDSEEISSDNDPNCPTGRDCNATAPINNPEADLSGDKVNPLAEDLLEEINNYEETDNSSLSELEKNVSGSMELSEIRKMLIDMGMGAELIDNISDEELIKVIDEVLAE